MSDTSEPPTCERCHHEYTMDTGDEQTPFCDSCAHAVVDQLRTDLARVTQEKDAAEAVAEERRERAKQAERERDEARAALARAPCRDIADGDDCTEAHPCVTHAALAALDGAK